MKSAVAVLIQLSIVAAVVIGVLFILRMGEERASESAAPEIEQVQPSKPATPADPSNDSEPATGDSESESVVKEEHAAPDLS